MTHYRLTLVITAITMALLANTVNAQDLATGEAVYNKSCKMCHASGMMNAPKLGDKAAWANLITKGEPALFASVSKGLNKMPARGNCKACSDDDLKNATAFMLKQVQ